MGKLLLAMPQPGVGQLTVAHAVNRLAPAGVQAISYYDLVIDELAEQFGTDREVLIKYLHRPTEHLAYFHHEPETRKLARQRGEDFYEPRTTAYHMARYAGRLDIESYRLGTMLAGLTADNLVIFTTHRDEVPMQGYAKATGREFKLLDLVRPGIPGLGTPRYRFQGGHLITNVEGAPEEAARAILELI